MTCDVCGLPDPYRGDGDGIGSCDCPRCDHGCGVARSSYLCQGPDDNGLDEDGEWDCRCGDICTCDYDEPWPDDVVSRPVVTVELPGISR
ncbi:hypothetical protein M3G91_10255 [Micromonospora chalcea]|uniref:hypothetical protein n=1 Tax=Micromonospora chalcea TaxID=1874 RepID=UPI0021A6EEB0|nr:hypothetical protein [Micromonospora chalcea]MCT2278007.1 hypothetical protein [Micromonospora chalcea]